MTDNFEFQTLYGMADPIKEVFVSRGITVREYAPIGDMLTGMAYLVRRLLENTANEGFIRSGYLENPEHPSRRASSPKGTGPGS